MIRLMLLFLILFSAGACARPPGDKVAALDAARAKIEPLHRKIRKPGPMDWLAQHSEPGQTFRQYVASSPVKPDGKRTVIYVLPIGDFSEAQRQVLDLTTEYMSLFFSREVRMTNALPLSVIPASARRRHPEWGVEQALTTYVMDRILKPRLPDDAAVLIAFTSCDLWPGEGWNFVFGQASLAERVGVWSLYRNGDPAKNEERRKTCLMRTMKTGVHETGHMFSMLHCTLYECCMCGSNHLQESDARPLWLCPECMAKVCWATNADPIARYRKLAAFMKKNGFDQEARFFEKSAAVLSGERDNPRDVE